VDRQAERSEEVCFARILAARRQSRLAEIQDSQGDQEEAVNVADEAEDEEGIEDDGQAEARDQPANQLPASRLGHSSSSSSAASTPRVPQLPGLQGHSALPALPSLVPSADEHRTPSPIDGLGGRPLLASLLRPALAWAMGTSPTSAPIPPRTVADPAGLEDPFTLVAGPSRSRPAAAPARPPVRSRRQQDLYSSDSDGMDMQMAEDARSL
jgi:hypothetical protein